MVFHGCFNPNLRYTSEGMMVIWLLSCTVASSMRCASAGLGNGMTDYGMCPFRFLFDCCLLCLVWSAYQKQSQTTTAASVHMFYQQQKPRFCRSCCCCACTDCTLFFSVRARKNFGMIEQYSPQSARQSLTDSFAHVA